MNVHLYSWAKPMASVIERALQIDMFGAGATSALQVKMALDNLSHDGTYLQHLAAHKLHLALKNDGRFLHTVDQHNPEAGWFTVPNQAFAKGVAYCYDEDEPDCVVFWWFNEDPNFK